MSVIATAVRELYGLFVEDTRFAAAILIWLALFAAFSRYAGGAARGPLLFVGFAAILIVSVRRATR
jgi:hypothetical protein